MINYVVLYLCHFSEDNVQGRDGYLVKTLLVACKKVSSLMSFV